MDSSQKLIKISFIYLMNHSFKYESFLIMITFDGIVGLWHDKQKKSGWYHAQCKYYMLKYGKLCHSRLDIS